MLHKLGVLLAAGVALHAVQAKAVVPHDAVDDSLCQELASYLPSECSLFADCTSFGCSIDLLDIDTILVNASLNVCASPISVSFSVGEEDAGFSWSDTFSTSETIPVPGLSIDIWGLGEAGVNLGLQLDGDRQGLSAEINIDACVSLDKNGHALQVRPGSRAHKGLHRRPDGSVEWTKCEPDPAFTIISFQALDFSGLPCGNSSTTSTHSHGGGGTPTTTGHHTTPTTTGHHSGSTSTGGGSPTGGGSSSSWEGKRSNLRKKGKLLERDG